MATINTQLQDPDKIIREVFYDKALIDGQSDLSVMQIESINKVKTLATLFNCELLKTHLDHLMLISKSRERKSMGEFVEALRSKKEDLAKAKTSLLLG